MKIKTAPADVTAGPDAGLSEGQFMAYASVFGNVDSYGDVVEPGAFKDSLAAWDASPNTLPVLWGHDSSDPFSNIGAVVSAVEDEHGLKVVGQLDIDTAKGQQVYRLLKGGRVNSMSFAYDVVDEAADKETGTNLLKALDLREVSVVMYPANPEAAVLAVKAAVEALAASTVKAGKTLSAANEAALRDVETSLTSVTKSLGAVLTSMSTPEPGKTSTRGPVKVEEPCGVKTEEPSRDVSVDADSIHFRIAVLERTNPS